MSFSIGQRLDNTPTSAHQAEPVGRSRANAGASPWETLKKVRAYRESAAQHCKQRLPTSATTDEKQGLRYVKSQPSMAWAKAMPNYKKIPDLPIQNFVASHRWDTDKETLEEAFEIQNQPLSASFIDPRDFFYTPPPVAHKIEIQEGQEPQKAVFVNRPPAPELAAARIQTIKADFELGQARMPAPTKEPNEKA